MLVKRTYTLVGPRAGQDFDLPLMGTAFRGGKMVFTGPDNEANNLAKCLEQYGVEWEDEEGFGEIKAMEPKNLTEGEAKGPADIDSRSDRDNTPNHDYLDPSKGQMSRHSILNAKSALDVARENETKLTPPDVNGGGVADEGNSGTSNAQADLSGYGSKGGKKGLTADKGPGSPGAKVALTQGEKDTRVDDPKKD